MCDLMPKYLLFFELWQEDGWVEIFNIKCYNKSLTKELLVVYCNDLILNERGHYGYARF